MKAKELRTLEEEELRQKLKELERNIIKINTQAATGANPKNIGQIKDMKRTKARIITILHQKSSEVQSK